MTTILSRGSLNFWVAVIGGASLVAQTPEQTEFFEKKIRPVLVKNCQGCHNPKVKTSGLDMSSSAGFFAGAASGSLIDKAKPSDSMLLQVHWPTFGPSYTTTRTGQPKDLRPATGPRPSLFISLPSGRNLRDTKVMSAFPTGLDERFKDIDGMYRAMRIGVNRALMRHKRLGESVAGWDEATQSPKIVPPEEIPELDTEWPADLYYGPRDNPKYKK